MKREEIKRGSYFIDRHGIEYAIMSVVNKSDLNPEGNVIAILRDDEAGTFAQSYPVDEILDLIALSPSGVTVEPELAKEIRDEYANGVHFNKRYVPPVF